MQASLGLQKARAHLELALRTAICGLEIDWWGATALALGETGAMKQRIWIES